nr:elongation factor 1-beta-like [Ipomoea batatas]
MVRTAAAGLQPPRPSPLAAGHRGVSFISDCRRWPSPLKVYAAVLEQPSADLFPNASKWYHDVSTKLAASFPGKLFELELDAKMLQQKLHQLRFMLWGEDDFERMLLDVFVIECCQVVDDDDDDMDLFGEETEEEKKAAEEKAVAAKASSKKKESEFTECNVLFRSQVLHQSNGRTLHKNGNGNDIYMYMVTATNRARIELDSKALTAFAGDNKDRGIHNPTQTLEELYSLLLITGHALA